MGVHKLWDLLKPVADERSLLNLSTKKGFDINNRRLRTFIVGDDISIRIESCLHARGGNQIAALETLFYQFCNLQEAPITFVGVLDGPGRPSVKRGVRRVRNNPSWLCDHVKDLLTAFGHYYYTAPGEAEAELAQLNKLGFIDAVITEDSDTIVFGASCVIRTIGAYVTDSSQVYTSESIASHPLYLDEDGLLIFALLVGGDYDRGVSKCGPKIAHALARAGFGRDLRRILTSFAGVEREEELATWRIALTAELRNNSAGSLDKRHPKLADAFPGNFPDLDVVELYMDPLTSWSSRFTGTPPVTSLWTPREPNLHQLSAFCVAHFGWQADIQSRFKANLWPGVALQMIFSRYIIYDETQKRLATPYTNGTLQKIVSRGVIKDSTLVEPLELLRVRISIANFIQKAGLQFEGGKDYVLVTVPLSILAVATRDLTLASTNMREVPSIESIRTARLDTGKENQDVIPDALDAVDGATSQGTRDGDVAMGDMVRAEVRERQLVEAHRRLAAEGVIDLTRTGQGS